MMRMMNNKANVKIFSIVIAAIFIIGIGALAYTQMATPSGNSGNSTIGVIDTSRMMSQDNPIYISAAQEYMSYQSQLQQETQAKIDAAQDDATKQKIAEEARQNLAQKDQEKREWTDSNSLFYILSEMITFRLVLQRQEDEVLL